MKRIEIVVRDIKELTETAKQILSFTEGYKVFSVYGEMGAGKTTLIKEICHQLGSRDNFSSPTYSIVNEYSIAISPFTRNEALIRLRIYHIDLYRLNTIEEAVAVGVEEYLERNKSLSDIEREL